MKIDRDYGLVASDDELNIYRRLDKQQKYNKKHNKASKRKSNTDKRKMLFMMIGSGDNGLREMD